MIIIYPIPQGPDDEIITYGCSLKYWRLNDTLVACKVHGIVIPFGVKCMRDDCEIVIFNKEECIPQEEYLKGL